MKEYIKLFNNHQEYEDFTKTDKFLQPNVSHCINENEVHYNPIKNWENEYLTIESLEDENTIYLKASDASNIKTVSVSTDNGATWTEYTSSVEGSGTTIAILNTRDVILLKGDNTTYTIKYNNGTSYYTAFRSTKTFNIKGNIMSLTNGDSFVSADELKETNTFAYMFNNCTGLISAENFVLPATTLTEDCYSAMFQGCTSLTTAPLILPAITLTHSCYWCMFKGCTSLRTAPLLPATTSATYCYRYMFDGCTNLITPPSILPATTLKDWCYASMFNNCTSLTTAPELPARTLVSGCYNSMFKGCTSLNYIKCLATSPYGYGLCNAWTYGVATTGKFVKAINSSWETGPSGIPNSWTVETVTK